MKYDFIVLEEHGYIYIIDIIENKFGNYIQEHSKKLNSFISNIFINAYYNKNSKILKEEDGYYIILTDKENDIKIKTTKKIISKWKNIYEKNIEEFV